MSGHENTRSSPWATELLRVVMEDGPLDQEVALWRAAAKVPPERALRYIEHHRAYRQEVRRRQGKPVLGNGRVVRRDQGYLLLSGQRLIAYQTMLSLLYRGLLVREGRVLDLGSVDPRTATSERRMAPWTRAALLALREAGKMDVKDLKAIAAAHVPRDQALRRRRSHVERTRQRRRDQGVHETTTRVRTEEEEVQIGSNDLGWDSVDKLCRHGLWARREGDTVHYVPYPPVRKKRRRTPRKEATQR